MTATLPRPVVLLATCLACGREVDPWRAGMSVRCKACDGRLFVQEADTIATIAGVKK